MLSQHVREIWFGKFKNLPSKPDGEIFRKLFETVCKVVCKWKLLNADERSDLSKSAHSSVGNSFGAIVPDFGGNKENVTP